MSRRKLILLTLAAAAVPLLIGVTLIVISYESMKEQFYKEQTAKYRSQSQIATGERCKYTEQNFSIIWPQGWKAEKLVIGDYADFWAGDSGKPGKIEVIVNTKQQDYSPHDLFREDSLKQLESDELFGVSTSYRFKPTEFAEQPALQVELSNPGIGAYPKPRREVLYYCAYKKNGYSIKYSLPWNDSDTVFSELSKVAATFRFE